MKHSLKILIIFLFAGIFVHAQQLEDLDTNRTDTTKVKRVAIGFKLGIPNLATGSAELILPFLNNHFAPYVDYSKIPLNFDEIETNIKYGFVELSGECSRRTLFPARRHQQLDPLTQGRLVLRKSCSRMPSTFQHRRGIK